MKADVIVLGAGIVGVSLALHLQERGRDVVLVDRTGPGEGTSFGNAGLIERASVIPYAFPRGLASLARYALNRSSDVRYDPRYIWRVAPFLFRYWRHSSPRRLALATQAMLPLIEASVAEHDHFITAAGAGDLVHAGGWLAGWRTPAKFEAAQRDLADLAEYGLAHDILDAAGIGALEPSLRTGREGLAGAIHWRDPKTVSDPGALTRRYAALFERRGGRIAIADAATVETTGRSWTVGLAQGPLEAPQAVVALGPQSGALLKRFGYSIPFAVKRGHHRHYRLPPDHVLRTPIVDEEAGFVLAPMTKGIRLTTGIEFADPAAPANAIQIGRAEAVARRLLPLGEPVEETPWLGLRPCLPDMRPIIGPAPRHPGLWFDFGHAHHGLTLGPASGRLLAELMTGETPFADPAPYRCERFL
ncbi:amino acid dehydrogenase [Aureimonas sp. Leaf454]|uniref:NAD(P)/FAD-dependent oxidoreductase n=1 Tax=Aureimonas sp. Leaf454 TaxID=1736381 RepID=UPI0006F5B50D|nr:FAD-binding oxidoreductase [Aureimonas sp. Leaf454]KQT46328.1 amino acid dehydrogenase [Aureimonas sp. Leaf454]